MNYELILRLCIMNLTQNSGNDVVTGFIAMHSISISHPGRHTGAKRITRGVSGKRSSNISLTTIESAGSRR